MGKLKGEDLLIAVNAVPTDALVVIRLAWEEATDEKARRILEAFLDDPKEPEEVEELVGEKFRELYR